MKALTIISIAAVALMFASCSKTGPIDGGQTFSNDPTRIGFGISTGARAVDYDISTVQDVGKSANGLLIAQVLNGKGTPVRGFLKPYMYNEATNTWAWSNPKDEGLKWPADGDENYPIVFYATADAAGTPDYVTDNGGGFPKDKWKILPNIALTAGEQTDYMAARAVVTKVPANGKVQLVFKHILSKVLFNIKGATDVVVNVQSIRVERLFGTDNNGNDTHYDLQKGEWVGLNDGNYFMNFTTYFYRSADMNGGVAQSITTANEGDVVAVENDGNGGLMVYPQYGLELWSLDKYMTGLNGSSGVKPVLDRYKAEGRTPEYIAANWINDINYDSGTLGNQFSSVIKVVYNVQQKTPTTEWLVGGENEFVHVAFPIDLSSPSRDPEVDKDKKWDPGKQYTYTIELGRTGASGGYLLDPYFLDQNGQPLPKLVDKPASAQVGKTINPKGKITFSVPSVGDWTGGDKEI